MLTAVRLACVLIQKVKAHLFKNTKYCIVLLNIEHYFAPNSTPNVLGLFWFNLMFEPNCYNLALQVNQLL